MISLYRLSTQVFYLLVVLLIISTQVIANTINGNVKDYKTNQPISNCLIEITNLTNGMKDTVYSNQSGNWQYTLVTDLLDDSKIIPTSLILEQNYPNPFNPSTKINFGIYEEGSVEIFIHNILGELIDQRSQFLSAGAYSIDWYSKGSAGVYFYTIKIGNQSFTKKMIQLDGGNGSGLSEIRAGIITSNKKSSKTSSIDIQVVISKFTYISDTTQFQITGNDYIETILRTVHSKAMMIDLHNDVIEVMIESPSYNFSVFNNSNHTDIPRLQQGEVDIQFFSLWVSPTRYPQHYQQTLNMVNVFNNVMLQNPNTIAQARTFSEAENILSSNKIAAVIGVEGGHSIQDNLNNLVTLYNAGMRYMTITWNNSTSWATSAKDTLLPNQGLTDFGRQVIRTMDSLGIIIDISHTGIQTMQDILQITTKPIIASHSGVRAIRNHYRNLYDSQIIDIANTGGVIGVVFYPYFLTGTSLAAISNVVQHINYIVNLVGIDHVAIGSDFDGIEVTPIGLENVSKFSALTTALLQNGYSQADIEKILGGNFRRVFEQVCGN